MKYILYLLLLSSCLVNPHDKEEFSEFIFENISLEGNLVFYHFNEPYYDGTSGEVIDSSGLNKNSTSINNPSKVQGIYGEGVYCDGNGTGINLEPNEFDDAFTKRTIAIWFRAESTTARRRP